MPGEDNTTLRVRGNGTMNNASPLIIIDGMEGSLNAINPQDIEKYLYSKKMQLPCAILWCPCCQWSHLSHKQKSGDRDKNTGKTIVDASLSTARHA